MLPDGGPAGVRTTARRKSKPTQHGRPLPVIGAGQRDAREGQTRPVGESERPIVPSKPGNAGGGKGPWFKTSVESGDSREIDDESDTSRKGWEATDGTACQSEGSSELSFLPAVRQAVSLGRVGVRLRTLQSQQRCSGSGRPIVRGHRGVWGETLAGGTGEGTPGQDVSAQSGEAGVDPETGWETATVGDTDDPRPRGTDGGSGDSRTDLRG